MLRNFGIISIVLFTSQLLVVVHARHQNTTWMCTEDDTIAFRVTNNGQSCHCLFVPQLDSGGIGKGYWYEPDLGFYKLHTVGATWNEARKICHNEGAHLAVINSQEEMQALSDRLDAFYHEIQADTTSHAYVGVHSHFGEEQPHFWTSVIGEWVIPEIFNPWLRVKRGRKCDLVWDDQPDGHGKEPCGALIRPCKAMADVKCDEKLAFFCEKAASCP